VPVLCAEITFSALYTRDMIPFAGRDADLYRIPQSHFSTDRDHPSVCTLRRAGTVNKFENSLAAILRG